MPVVIESQPSFGIQGLAAFAAGGGAARRERQLTEYQTEVQQQNATIDFIRKSLLQQQSAAMDAQLRRALQDQLYRHALDVIAFKDFGSSYDELNTLAQQAGQPMYDFLKELKQDQLAEAQKAAETQRAQDANREALKAAMSPAEYVEWSRIDKDLKSQHPDVTAEELQPLLVEWRARQEEIEANVSKPPTVQQQWDSGTITRPDGSTYAPARTWSKLTDPTFKPSEWNKMVAQEEADDRNRYLIEHDTGEGYTPDYAAISARIMARMQTMPGYMGPTAPPTEGAPTPGQITGPPVPSAPRVAAPTPPAAIDVAGQMIDARRPPAAGPPALAKETPVIDDVEHAKQMVDSLVRDLGSDPDKWGDLKDAGLRAAFQAVLGNRTIPEPVARDLRDELEQAYAGVPKSELPRDVKIVARKLLEILE